MKKTMVGLFKTQAGAGNMELREVASPRPGPGDVLIAVAATGICGSDLHIYHSDISLAMRFPVITGHEFSGTIVELGAGVSGLELGQRVSGITSYEICGKCINCKTGKTNICQQKKLIGYWYDGAFANYIVIPAHNVQVLPDNVSFHEGAVLEPLSCAVEAVVELTRIKPEDVVVVMGPGLIGQLVAQVAKLCGGRVVVAGTDKDARRLSLAEKLGADHVVNIGRDDLAGYLDELTQGLGADVVFECSGAAAAARTGLDVLRRGGQYTQVGLFGKPIDINFEQIAYKEAKVTGSLGQNWLNWHLALKLLKYGRVQVLPLVSDVLTLDRWEEGFQSFTNGSGLKILLEPIEKLPLP